MLELLGIGQYVEIGIGQNELFAFMETASRRLVMEDKNPTGLKSEVV
jgi:hypothetical protein